MATPFTREQVSWLNTSLGTDFPLPAEPADHHDSADPMEGTSSRTSGITHTLDKGR